MNKLLIILAAAVFLGGCTLGNNMMGQSAQDQAMEPQPTPTPLASTTPDFELEAIPAPAKDTDSASIEADLNSTVILDEDFSDLE